MSESFSLTVLSTTFEEIFWVQ